MKSVIGRAGLLGVCIVGLGGSVAFAQIPNAPADNDESTAVVLESDYYVVVETTSDAAVEVGDAEFYPIGEEVSDDVTVVLAEDGVLPNGMTVDQLRQDETVLNKRNISSRATRSFVAVQGVWSKPYVGDTVWGKDSTARAVYSFWTDDHAKMIACGQGKGYYRGYNGSTFGLWTKWHGFGCTSTSNGLARGGSVPWGNVFAKKEFKVASGGLVATGSWG